MLSLMKKLLSHWFRQYELITCSYMFEPWEKMLLHSSVMLIVSLVCYSSYVYLPSYITSLIEECKHMMT